MQKNILWSGREYYSLEHCMLKTSSGGAVISSTIIGYYEQKMYKVAYTITTNPDWHTISAHIECQHNNAHQKILLETDATGNWLLNHVPAKQFAGCTDIDLPLTPFTNTLPIRRLQLQPGDSREIRVIYCDLLSESLLPVSQLYTCISATKYHYQNVPNDFEALITVDEDGLVIDYPELFVRTAVED